jgi:hypothetical protein
LVAQSVSSTSAKSGQKRRDLGVQVISPER